MNEEAMQEWLFPVEGPKRTYPDPLDTAVERLFRDVREARRTFRWSHALSTAMRDEAMACQTIAAKLGPQHRAAVNAILKSNEYEDISLLGILRDVASW